MNKIPLIKPYVTDEVKQLVCEVLDSGYLTEGPVTKQFEAACRDFIGCRHAIAVCNCTVGLEVALRAVGIGAGDEVVVPDYTYPATASAVNIVGATAVIVDVDPLTMNVDYAALERAITPRTKAIMPVSLFGNPLDYDRLNAIKARHNVLIIEDAACSIGAEFGDERVGNLADITVFSFHPRKFITTGEGGLITTNNDAWAAWMDSYKHFGMGTSASREGTVFERIGTNYKLSNIQSAVGLVQMRHIGELLAKRRELATRYREKNSGVAGILASTITAGGNHSWQSCCFLVERRNEIMAAMRAAGIEVQIGTYSLHMHPAYQPSPLVRWATPSFPGSRRAFDEALVVPLFHDLTEADQDRVIAKLVELVRG